MENLLKQIEILREQVKKTQELLDIEGKRQESSAKKIKMNEPSFWNNREKAVILSQEVEELDKEVEKWNDLEKQITDLEELVAVANKEDDNSITEEAREKFNELRESFDELEFHLLLSSKYDRNNAIVSIHAGTGGVDAQDWAEILERMLFRFAEKKGCRVKILDRNTGNEAGIKNITFSITGLWAYGYLKSENGVHRLVRISPFDAESMRHTSFALVEVLPELPDDSEIEIKDEDLKIDTFGSSGPGGQSVNRTESAVRITHKPSGIVVNCQNEKSQHQNKEMALKILKSKLHILEEKLKEEKRDKLKGGIQTAEWGKQIRSYVFQPYTMVKDHRTGYETSDLNNILDGNLDSFVEAYLRDNISK
jgi:peptide chain release factor 2